MKKYNLYFDTGIYYHILIYLYKHNLDYLNVVKHGKIYYLLQRNYTKKCIFDIIEHCQKAF